MNANFEYNCFHAQSKIRDLSGRDAQSTTQAIERAENIPCIDKKDASMGTVPEIETVPSRLFLIG